jgi:hypothetical protein
MGQAKLRAKEIEQLKNAKGKEYSILAIRHCEDGSKEFCYFQASPEKITFAKNDLLSYICLKDWIHTPPAAAIAHYLWQTNTFQMMNNFDYVEGFEINFFEYDPEISARKGDKVCSCRTVVAGKKESIEQRAHQLKEELAQTGEYSIRENHK